MSGIPTFARVVKRSHRVYTHTEIDGVLDYISSPVIPRGALAKIERDTLIPKQTLSDWRRHRTNPDTPQWFPLAEGCPSRRALPPEVEDAIYSHMKENFVDNGVGATHKTLSHVAMTAYASQDVGTFRVDRFTASNRWRKRFLDEKVLSLRTPHTERRTTIDEDYVAFFLSRMESLKDDYPPSRVVNFDETCWRFSELPRFIPAEKGTETVKLKCAQGEKQSVTAIGAITADGQKLPFWILAKGKTDRVLHKFGTPGQTVLKVSQSGWTNEAILLEYLEWLHTTSDGCPLILVLDVYPAHRTAAIRNRANELDIELLYVPAGGTSQYQPLDRRIFGELKSRARAEMDRLAVIEGSRDCTHERAISILEGCWSHISTENIKKAWNIV